MTFYVSEFEWFEAKENLTGKPSGTKFNKYPVEPSKNLKVKWLELRKHSFVILDEIIYALSNKQDFTPEKRDGLIFKKGQTEEGKEVIIEQSNTGSDKYRLVACIPPRSKVISKPSSHDLPKENNTETKLMNPTAALIFSPFQMPDFFSDHRLLMASTKTSHSTTLNITSDTDTLIKEKNTRLNTNHF